MLPGSKHLGTKMFITIAKILLFGLSLCSLHGLTMDVSDQAMSQSLQDPAQRSLSETMARNSAFGGVMHLYFAHNQPIPIYSPSSKIKVDITVSSSPSNGPAAVNLYLSQVPVSHQIHRHQQTGFVFHPQGILTSASSLHRSLLSDAKQISPNVIKAKLNYSVGLSSSYKQYTDANHKLYDADVYLLESTFNQLREHCSCPDSSVTNHVMAGDFAFIHVVQASLPESIDFENVARLMSDVDANSTCSYVMGNNAYHKQFSFLPMRSFSKISFGRDYPVLLLHKIESASTMGNYPELMNFMGTPGAPVFSRNGRSILGLFVGRAPCTVSGEKANCNVISALQKFDETGHVVGFVDDFDALSMAFLLDMIAKNPDYVNKIK